MLTAETLRIMDVPQLTKLRERLQALLNATETALAHRKVNGRLDLSSKGYKPLIEEQLIIIIIAIIGDFQLFRAILEQLLALFKHSCF